MFKRDRFQETESCPEICRKVSTRKVIPTRIDVFASDWPKFTILWLIELYLRGKHSKNEITGERFNPFFGSYSVPWFFVSFFGLLCSFYNPKCMDCIFECKNVCIMRQLGPIDCVISSLKWKFPSFLAFFRLFQTSAFLDPHKLRFFRVFRVESLPSYCYIWLYNVSPRKSTFSLRSQNVPYVHK